MFWCERYKRVKAGKVCGIRLFLTLHRWKVFSGMRTFNTQCFVQNDHAVGFEVGSCKDSMRASQEKLLTSVRCS